MKFFNCHDIEKLSEGKVVFTFAEETPFIWLGLPITKTTSTKDLTQHFPRSSLRNGYVQLEDDKCKDGSETVLGKDTALYLPVCDLKPLECRLTAFVTLEEDTVTAIKMSCLGSGHDIILKIKESSAKEIQDGVFFEELQKTHYSVLSTVDQHDSRNCPLFVRFKHAQKKSLLSTLSRLLKK